MALTKSVQEIIDADKTGLLAQHPTWNRIQLRDVGEILNGFPFQSKDFNASDGTPLIRIRDVSTGKSGTFFSDRFDEQFLVQAGDFLVGMDGDFNCARWRSDPALLNQRVCKVTISSKFYSSRLFEYLLPGYLAAIHRETLSVTVKHLSSRTIEDIELPLPPAAEQTRIVEKLEELLSDLDAGVAELKAAQKKLAQYRRALLKAAAEGSLTATWRAAQHSAPLPPRGGGVGGEGARAIQLTTPKQQQHARELRSEQTPPEQALWQHLRAKRFADLKFRRQQPLGRYIVDFVCFAKRLIVELDGGQHAEQQDYDATRDAWLRAEGFRVLRIWNSDWHTQQEAALEAIWNALHEPPPPLPNPSPARGEGLERETGAQLLARILTERRKRWEAKQLAKFAELGKASPKDWQSKYPEPVSPDTTDLPALPAGWVWATIDQLAHVGTGVTPLRSKNVYFINGTVPWVTSGALNSETVSAATEMVTDVALKECRLELYPPGSLLVAMYGEGKTRGKCAELLIPATINQAIAAIVWEPESVSCKPYIKAFLLNSYEMMRGQASGGVQPNLNLQIVKSLVVPLPPVAEQSEIVGQLALLSQQIDQQRRAVDLALKQSAAQRKNILKAAFSGQLVPQDPNDESASVLLARIRAERAAGNVHAREPKAPKGKA